MSKIVVLETRHLVPEVPKNLPSDNGENMDSPWHRNQIQLLIHVLEYHWRERKDFYCGGNMFVHFSEERARNRDFRGPDFFVALEADHDRPRTYWAIWEERGRYPNFILELLSPSTANEDLTTKKDVYEQTFRTPEYFCLDPRDFSLMGWRLSGNRYRSTEVGKDHRMWSEVLELSLGPWHGTYDGLTGDYIRFFDAQGRMLPTPEEAEAARADEEARRADEEARRADEEARRADEEAKRANIANAEIDRLRKELDDLRKQQSQNGKS
jgi:Uma2 family endonuclease